jgi:hypothetical protein
MQRCALPPQDVDNTRKRFVRAMSVSSLSRYDAPDGASVEVEESPMAAGSAEDDQSHVWLAPNAMLTDKKQHSGFFDVWIGG